MCIRDSINPALMFDFEKQDIVADSYTFHKTKGSSGTARSMASGEGLFYKAVSYTHLSFKSASAISKPSLVRTIISKRFLVSSATL